MRLLTSRFNIKVPGLDSFHAVPSQFMAEPSVALPDDFGLMVSCDIRSLAIIVTND